MEKITIKDIKVGMKFCQPELVHPHNQMMTIKSIKYNKNAGKPIKDMWGSVVWAEPLATIMAVGSITKKKKYYSVQSKNSNLSDWLTFTNKPSERINAIYQNRREELVRVAKENLKEVIKKLDELKKYPAPFRKDASMQKFANYIEKATIEIH